MAVESHLGLFNDSYEICRRNGGSVHQNGFVTAHEKDSVYYRVSHMVFRSENFQKDILSGKRFQCIKVCSLVDDLFFYILFRKRLGLRRYIYLEFFQETVELQLCV